MSVTIRGGLGEGYPSIGESGASSTKGIVSGISSCGDISMSSHGSGELGISSESRGIRVKGDPAELCCK
jgi:hypothetical protein